MSVVNKRFLTMHGTITGRDARKKYPDPLFFERARPSMKPDEIRDILLRNIEEVERVCGMFRTMLENHHGTLRKQHMLHPANKLHDFRISLDMHGGERGRPYLWEE